MSGKQLLLIGIGLALLYVMFTAGARFCWLHWSPFRLSPFMPC
ncbi:hypothetical protein CM49_03485 [Paenibacillus sp. P1XP2]|nr:hypothetical protein CM49_03485 [Paenibacillus sp. P1XP2]